MGEESDLLPATISTMDTQLVECLYAQFITMDADHTGFITQTDFANSMGALFDDAELAQYLFNALDTNGDGQLSLEEYLEGMRVPMCGKQTEKLAFAFKILDSDSDGALSRADLQRFLQAVFRYPGSGACLSTWAWVNLGTTPTP